MDAMNTIQLQGDISFEQYQMAVNVLEAIGLKVKKQKNPQEDFVLSDEQKKILDSRSKRAIYKDADKVLAELKLKYEL